jgi:hypothetical protein
MLMGESEVCVQVWQNPALNPVFVMQTHQHAIPHLLSIKTRYLVDPASSHMLVSKTKPCMSKNKPLNGESANGSLNQLLFI